MNAIFANRMFESGVGIRSNFFNSRDTSFLGQAVEVQPSSGMLEDQRKIAPVTDRMPRPEKPSDVRVVRPAPFAYNAKRFERLLLRLCSIMTRFSERGVDMDVQSRIFWSYIRHSRQPEATVLATFQEMCPTIQVPPKPTTPDREIKVESPEKAGFKGKAQITYPEAKELLTALDEVLKPLTPEELANDIGREECLRDLAAGNFPIVEDLHERLAEFVAAGDTAAAFEISPGEMNVTGKAIDCAVALGRGRAIRTALTAGGAIGAGALLLFLL